MRRRPRTVQPLPVMLKPCKLVLLVAATSINSTALLPVAKVFELLPDCV